MNTDLNKVNNSIDLIRALRLENENFSSLSAAQLITDTWEYVKPILADQNDTSFTDHKITHSLRIIEYFLDFNNLFDWSPYSKLIFSISALIHDIGMQYKTWHLPEMRNVVNENGSEIFPNRDTISDKDVRITHCELGFNLIDNHINNKFNIPFPRFLCNKDEYKEPLKEAMYIAFSHSSKSPYFEQFKNSRWKRIKNKYTGFSPVLLACILRICDEFDCSELRIERTRLPTSALDDYGYSQWLICNFIKSSKLFTFSDEERDPYLEITWQAPENLEDEEYLLIKNFLYTNRIIKIKSEIKLVNNLLFETNEADLSKLLNLSISNLDGNFQYCDSVFMNKDKMYRIMKKYFYGLDLQEERKLDKIDSFSEENINLDMKTRLNSIQKKLETWFYSQINTNHYILETGDHTDVFLNCRSLISNQILLREIGKYIYQYFIFNDINIDCALAIGTSAIPIAINYQIFSNCKSTFTMNKKKISVSGKNHEEYISTEIIPILLNSKNILLIDDIISLGDVTKTIIDEYLSKGKIENIYHLSLFRLGSRDLIYTNKIKKFMWFLHIPWIYYWREGIEERTDCMYCEAGIEPVYEKDM